jgi:uncharacterized protein
VARREPAWRVTTGELALAREEERGEGERVASYLIGPFGARMNRVVVVGTLSAAEPAGRDDPPTFWRSRLTDPLGSVVVTAGSFQPRAAAQLRSAPAGRPALVVGKVHLYRPRAGDGSVSVRAEAVRHVAEDQERATLAEIVRQSLDRLDLLDRLEHEPGIPDTVLRAAGEPAIWIRGAREALRRYPSADRAGYRAALRAAVARVAGTGVLAGSAFGTEGVRLTIDPPPVTPKERSDSERADDATFLGLVDEATEGSEDGYADVRELFRRLADRGVGTEQAEATLGRLEEDGLLHEPIVGKLRRA